MSGERGRPTVVFVDWPHSGDFLHFSANGKNKFNQSFIEIYKCIYYNFFKAPKKPAAVA